MNENFDYEYEYEPIDLEACFAPVFEPPIDFLDECRKRWERYYDELQKSKSNSFYVTNEYGVTYFCFGKDRIRVTEHFAECGRTYGKIAEEAVRYSVRTAETASKSLAS